MTNVESTKTGRFKRAEFGRLMITVIQLCYCGDAKKSLIKKLKGCVFSGFLITCEPSKYMCSTGTALLVELDEVDV